MAALLPSRLPQKSPLVELAKLPMPKPRTLAELMANFPPPVTTNGLAELLASFSPSPPENFLLEKLANIAIAKTKEQNMGKLHHLKVGCGDASVIVTDTDTFLIDCHNIGDFSHLLPATKKLRGVFITHQHADHYSGLQYLKDEGYSIDFLVYSPYSRRRGDNSVTLDEWNEFNGLKDYFVTEGTQTRTPYRQDSWDKAWWVASGVSFWIIGPDKGTAGSETRELHDACLVIKAHIGNRMCLFAGDASDANLEYITDHTKNFCNDILHASHHGSINGAHLDFIKKCSAQYTVISTESGVYDNVPDTTALSRYTKHTEHDVYRTDVAGSLEWTF